MMDPATQNIALSVVGTLTSAKFLLAAARTMPPPKEPCHYLFRWLYDLVQALGENPDKQGQSRILSSPVDIDQRILSQPRLITVEAPVSVPNVVAPQGQKV